MTTNEDQLQETIKYLEGQLDRVVTLMVALASNVNAVSESLSEIAKDIEAIPANSNKEVTFDDWTRVTVIAPPDLARLFMYFATSLGFRDVDWCVMEEERTLARLDYDPCEPITTSEYTGYKTCRDDS